MQNSIRIIIDTIESGHIFDSHFVIAQLIKNHSDVYLNFASNIDTPVNKTSIVHGHIAQEIARHEDTIIQRVENMSWSETIHGTARECTCWQKI